MTDPQEARALYDLAKNTRDSCVIEVGSFRGRSTVALGLGSLEGHQVPVYAIEPHEPFEGILGGQFGPEYCAAFYKAMLETSCYQIVRLVNLSSEQVSSNWQRPVGLLWIDGDHSYEGVKRDFDCWRPHLTSNATVAFDDSINPEIGPKRLIDELIDQGILKQNRIVGKITILDYLDR